MRYTAAKSRGSYTFDALLEMKDAGLVAADAAAQVDGSNKILDVGDARFEAKLIIDVTAIEVASGDEGYTIKVQGSDASNFGSGVETITSLTLGDTSVTGNSVDSTTGRYELGVSNIGADGQPYRYLRLYTDVTGTIATGINYSAFFTPNK